MKYLFTLRAWWLIFFAVLASCSSSRVVGLERGWDILGDRKVNFIRDKDFLEVRSTVPYTAIRFKVEDQDVKINDVKIVFSTGDKLEPAMDEVIKKGEWSRIIDLGREGRTITGIEFKYRSMGSILGGRARVIVTGRRFDYYGY